MFNYCPACGNKDSVVRQNSTDYECSVCNWHFWNNAKATASAIFINGNHEILFAKRGIEPNKGLYDLPGGFLEFNETAYEGFMREMREELSVIPKRPQLFPFTYKNEYVSGAINTCDLLFVVKEWDGAFSPTDDVEAVEWLPIEVVESGQFAWKYTGFVRHLQDYLAA